MSIVRKVDIRDGSGTAFDYTNPLYVNPGFSDPNNTTTTPLAGGGVYTGTSTNIINASVVQVYVFTDVASADNGLVIQFQHSNSAIWRDGDSYTVTANSVKPYTFHTVGAKYRIVYTNGASAQSTFELESIVKTGYAKSSTHNTSEAIPKESDGELTISVITGQDPTGDFRNVKTTTDNALSVSIDNPVTAFGDLEVAQLTPQFQYSFEYTVDNTDLLTNTVVAGGTVTQSNGMALVGTSTTTGSTAMLTSTSQAKYRAGLGAMLRYTVMFTTPVAGTLQYVGIVDELGSSATFKNGFTLGYNGTQLCVTRWQNDVAFQVNREDWDDPLDGTGKSSMTIDTTKITPFTIKFQYLGAGEIAFQTENPITGRFFNFHRIKYANANTTPSIYNPNLKYTIYVDNGATTSDMVVKSASVGFFIEGNTKLQEIHQPQNTSGKRQKTAVTTQTAIFSIRNKSTYASKTNFVSILLENIGCSIEAGAANNLGEVTLIKNPTLGGTPSWSDINTNNSVVEIDTAGTTVTGGQTLYVVPLAGKNDKDNSNLIDFDIILQPGDMVTVAGESANSATINGVLLWKELF